ncbi:MAG: exodeoxyribonuclease VII small subunit [Anaerolineae bacterium]
MSESPTFEALYRELEEAVRRLEAGDLSLEDALALYARANALAEQCNALLDRAELRVRQVTVQPNGGLTAEPFNATSVA